MDLWILVRQASQVPYVLSHAPPPASLASLTVVLADSSLKTDCPAEQWQAFQSALAQCYAACTRWTHKENLLLDVTVIVPAVCGYDPLLECTGRLLHCASGSFCLSDSVKKEIDSSSALDAPLVQTANEHRHEALQAQTLPDPPESTAPPPAHPSSGSTAFRYSHKIQYTHVALGGTFDHLHSGHKLLLTTAAYLTSGTLLVGVVSPSCLTSKSHASLIQPLPLRMATVSRFVHKVKRGIAVNPVEIVDAFGPTVTDASVDAIVGSLETLSGCHLVNEERMKKGFERLDVFAVDLISATSVLSEGEAGVKLSSTFVRETLLAQSK